MSRASRYVVTADNVVHERWHSQGQSYTGHNDTTPAEMAELLARGDSQSQFGSTNKGPSILKPCDECILGTTHDAIPVNL